MSPRGEQDEEFADFELVNEGAFDYAGTKQTLVEPTKSSPAPAIVITKPVSVQSTPIRTDLDIVKDAIVELRGQFSETSAETAGQLQEVQNVLDIFGAQLGVHRKSQDLRMRTLEYCFDDYEAELTNCTISIATLKEQLTDLQAASQDDSDLSDLRQISKETADRCVESASRLDFIVGHHLPTIEQKIRTIQSERKESDFISNEFRRTITDVRIQLGDLTEMQVMEVRKMAEDANLRSKDVQSDLRNLITKLIPVLEDKVHELAATAAKAFADYTAAFLVLSSDVEALKVGQETYRESMATDLENLATVDSQLIDEIFQCKDRLNDAEEVVKTLRSKEKIMAAEMENMITVQSNAIDETNDIKDRTHLAEEIIQHLVGKVVPLLQSRIQEQQELLEIANKAAVEEKMKSAEREAILFKHIQKLDEKAARADMVSLQNLQLQLRLNILEKALNELEREVKQVRLQQEQKAQVVTSLQSVHTQTEDSTPAEISEEIEELIDEVIEEAIEEANEADSKLEMETSLVAPPKPPRSGPFTIHCKTLLGEAITVSVPTFVSVRYLKQLIYFKSGCTMHPTKQSLVYAGKVLQDGWKVGGGMFARDDVNGGVACIEGFSGVSDGSTVLIVLTKKFLE